MFLERTSSSEGDIEIKLSPVYRWGQWQAVASSSCGRVTLVADRKPPWQDFPFVGPGSIV